MKRLLFIVLTIGIMNCYGQTNYINVCIDCYYPSQWFDFNSPDDSTGYYFSIDTTQTSNLWQLGIPDKTVFNYGLYGPKAFVTDTLNPYPINNTSSFQFSIINCPLGTGNMDCGGYTGFSIDINTMINSDQFQDGGTIEISHNGSPFINLIDDSLAFYINGDIYSATDTIKSMGKPGYSGTSNTWNHLTVGFDPTEFEVYDTITMKFTFSSDSIETNKDGWLIGKISAGGMYEGIEEIQNDNLISIYPNPASGELRIERINDSHTAGIQVFNFMGQLIYNDTSFTKESFDTSQFLNGFYLLRYSDSEYFAIKKFVVQH